MIWRQPHWRTIAIIDQELVALLVELARADGAELVGQNGLLPARSAQVINGYLANLINRDIG